MAYKESIVLCCVRGLCREPATHRVIDHGCQLGPYCERHADETIMARENYGRAVERASRRNP